MNPERTLGEFEQIVLLAVLRLGDQAYGVTILDEIAAKTGRNPAPGALYTTLHRMEDKGLVTFRDGSPTPERGGRAKRFVVVTREGRNALASAQSAYRSLLQGLDLLDAQLFGGAAGFRQAGGGFRRQGHSLLRARRSRPGDRRDARL